MKFGIFYELQLPRPWEVHSELQLFQNALDQVELADKLKYDTAWMVEHHFLEEYSHASSPSVFLGAASQRTKKHPSCPRHFPADHQSSGEGRSPRRQSRSRLARPRRVRHGRKRVFDRTRSVRRRIRGEARDVGGRGPLPDPDVQGRALGIQRQVLQVPLAQRGAQAAAEAAPAAVGRLLAARHHRVCRPRGMGALGFQFVSADAAHAWVHAYYNAITKPAREARRLSDQPEHRAGLLFHVREDGRGSAAAGRGPDVLPVRTALLRCQRQSRAPARRHGRRLAEVHRVEERQPRGRPAALRAASSVRPIRSARSCGSSSPATPTRSSCSIRPARTLTSTFAKASSCSPRR